MSNSLRENAVELTAEGIVHLYRLVLRQGNGILYFTPDSIRTWQGNDYDAVPCELSGVGVYADEKSARPRFTMQNPDGAFTGIISQGSLENARLTRFRLLRAHAEQDLDIAWAQTWRVARVSSLNKYMLSLELRDMADRANFVIPSRTFSPPEFPAVTLR